jgi:hypothetical protein
MLADVLATALPHRRQAYFSRLRGTFEGCAMRGTTVAKHSRR